MSVDFEKVTLEQLSAMKRSQQYEYAAYWQKYHENGIKLEWYSMLDKCWKFNGNSNVQSGYLYRLKPQPKTKIVPLDFSDYLDIKDKWLISSDNDENCFISGIDGAGNLKVIYSSFYEWISFKDLQILFRTIDGKRLEKEIEVV